MFQADDLIFSTPWMLVAILVVAAFSVLEYKMHTKWLFTVLTAIALAGAVACLLILGAALSDMLLFALAVLVVRLSMTLWEGRHDA